jgi:hypothetical protein
MSVQQRIQKLSMDLRVSNRVSAINTERRKFARRFTLDTEFRKAVLEGVTEYMRWTYAGQPDRSVR